MALSFKNVLGFLAVVSLFNTPALGYPFPLLEERQAATIPDYVSTYGTQPDLQFPMKA